MCASAHSTSQELVPVLAPAWSRTPWGAIMMGAIAAIGFQFVFTMLGIAIGVSASSDADLQVRPSVRVISIAGGAWWLLSGAVSLFLGGWVLGRVSDEARGVPLKLASLVMWGVVAMFGFVVIWSGASMAADSPLATLYARAPLPSDPVDTSTMTADNSPIRVGARDATRSASWWTVTGLLGGLGMSIAGAVVGARTARRLHASAPSPSPSADETSPASRSVRVMLERHDAKSQSFR